MFGRKHKIRKAVDRTLAGMIDEVTLDFAPIEALATPLHGDAYGLLALTLYHDERYAAARTAVERAIAAAPADVGLHELAASVAIEEGRLDDAIAPLTWVVEARPREANPVVVLGGHLLALERLDEAIALLEPRRAWGDPAINHVLAEVLFVRGDGAAALELLDEVCAYYDAAMKHAMGVQWNDLKARSDEADRLRADVYAELHGREATIELAAAARKLDAKAGVNYRLLGARLAADSDRIAEVLELEDPDATELRARRLLASAPDGAAGLVLLGATQLRRGEVAAARKTFERACESDGRCFAAFLGLGAAMDHESYDLHRRATRLPAAPSPSAELSAVVPDLLALTGVERQVVWASARPLAHLLPALAGAGVTIRILPIDVRATDIGLFEDLSGEREHADQRSYDAISGLATHGGAVAKIEELLDIMTDAGWTFAHELAHLAFFHMPDELAAPLHALYQRAIEVGYANTDYALSNPDEFFAVSYTEWLRVRHELPSAPIADDAGIHEGLKTYFDSLVAR